jgi:predicted lipoprotein with Yx(FWY)xxD motif
MRRLLLVWLLPTCMALPVAAREAFIPEPLPKGFSVRQSVIDGPVFADARGRTLYRWPFKVMRNGITGDTPGESGCTDEPARVSGGLMSPYPPGLLMPEPETRPACTAVWPPALAAEDVKAVGRFSIITRKDGRKQWALDGAALYTSVLDKRPGDVIGSYRGNHRGDLPALRDPVGPAPDLPPGFIVSSTHQGRVLRTERGFSVYAKKGGRDAGVCDDDCLQIWEPLPAPASARPRGDWKLLTRKTGELQWSFRGQALFRYKPDPRPRAQDGADEPGWHLVHVQEAPPVPAEFTVQASTGGLVLADAEGRTIYTYVCGDDAPDQLGCDHPSQTQVYRLALCGAGSAERCLKNFPYVTARRGAKASGLWTVVTIDPQSGRFAAAGAPGAERVWAYRDRPVYTYAGDERPGDINADNYGEFRAQRQGYSAIWLRNDFVREEG